ncbi:Type II toxin-antitoxin system Phd/YefM family antitoxin [Gammaproteobacteria bacterium]
MLELHPNILEKEGKKEFVVLPYEEFLALQQILADAQDLIDLREAKNAERHAPSLTFNEVRQQLGL